MTDATTDPPPKAKATWVDPEVHAYPIEETEGSVLHTPATDAGSNIS